MSNDQPPQNSAPSANTSPDAHGHNPADYEWVPVLRKPRKDGWTPDKQRAFIGALADSGVVLEAARSVGMSEKSCYRLRRSPGAEGFAAAWNAALDAASRRLADIAFDRAINGVDDIVLDRDGNHVYTKRKYNDRLLMFLLRAHNPGKYRHAHRDVRSPGEGDPETGSPVAEALKLLSPAKPAEAHKLMSLEQLDDALEVADIMDGKLPHWQRQDGETADGEGEVLPSVPRLTINKLHISDNDAEKTFRRQDHGGK